MTKPAHIAVDAGAGFVLGAVVLAVMYFTWWRGYRSAGGTFCAFPPSAVAECRDTLTATKASLREDVRRMKDIRSRLNTKRIVIAG